MWVSLCWSVLLHPIVARSPRASQPQWNGSSQLCGEQSPQSSIHSPSDYRRRNQEAESRLAHSYSTTNSGDICWDEHGWRWTPKTWKMHVVSPPTDAAEGACRVQTEQGSLAASLIFLKIPRPRGQIAFSVLPLSPRPVFSSPALCLLSNDT